MKHVLLLFLSFTFYSAAQSQNSWTQKSNFSGSPRSGSIGFSIGSKGYIGLGWDGNIYNKDFWEWDQSNNTWTQKADYGGTGTYFAVGFSIGTKGYIGTGEVPLRKDFWEYDQLNNSWQQKADFGGTARGYAIGFSIGNKGYIGLGWNGTTNCIDFWEWEQSTDTWTQKANFISGRQLAVGFAIGGKGYVGTGKENGFTYKNDFWEFNPLSNSWNQKANFPGTPRYDAIGFSIFDKGYIGTGYDYLNSDKKDFWEYDPSTDSWLQKMDFGGASRFESTSFSIGSKGYLGLGTANTGILKNDFWEYNPSGNCLGVYYPFSGNAADSSGNGNNGTVYGALPTTDRFGNSNGALSFNGSTDQVVIPSTFLDSTNQFTITGWFYADSVQSGYSDILQIDVNSANINNPDNNILIRYDGGLSQFSFLTQIQDSGNYIYTTPPSVQEWHFFSLVYNGNSCKAFLDGVFVGSHPLSGVFESFSQPIYIGNWNSLEGFRGKIDEIKFYNCALSDSEVIALYNPSNGLPLATICDTLIFGTPGIHDFAGHCIKTTDGNIAVVGSLNYPGNYSSGDIFLNKYDNNLNLLWSKVFYTGGGIDVAEGLINTSDGGFLIHKSFGMSNPDGMFSAGYIIKTDAAGNQEWVQTLTGQGYGDNYSSFAVENSQGEFICYGHVQHHAGCSSYATRITKLSATGVILWSYCTPLWPDWNGGMDKLIFSDNYISIFNNISIGNIEIRKWNDNGSQTNLINYKYASQFNSSAGVRRCITGGFFVFGQYDSIGGQKNAFISKFDDGMNLLWEKSYNNSLENIFTECTEDNSGNIYLSGNIKLSVSDQNIVVVKFDSSGILIDNLIFDYLNSTEYSKGICVNNSGDIFCSGAASVNGWNDAMIIKICDLNNQPCTSPAMILPDSTFFCGSSYILDAGSGAESYIWSTGATTQSITALQSGWYKCTVRNDTCTAVDSTYLSLLNANILNNDTTICPGSNVILTANISSTNNTCSLVQLPANLQNGLVAYYPFCGNANDESGNANNGIVYGATLNTDRFGNLNSAYSFNGVSDYIEIPNSSSLENIDSISISCWIHINNWCAPNLNGVKFFPVLERYNVIGGNIYGTYGLQLTESHNNYFHFKANDYNYNQFNPNFWQLNQWHNLVVTVQNDTGKWYINGVLISTVNAVNFGNYLANLPILIGKQTPDTTSLFADGKIDDIGIWNRPLSESEIQQLYTGKTYSWSNGATTSTINATPSQNTTYYCTVTQSGQSCTDSVTVNVLISDDSNACTIDACDPATGYISHTPLNNSPQNLIFANSIGGSSFEQGYGVAVDSYGNSIIAGTFALTVDFDPASATYNITSNGSNDAFIAKYDSIGELLWAKTFGGAANDFSYSVSVSNNGEIYATGYFNGTVDFDPGPNVYNLSSAGGQDVFVIKFDLNGNFLWAIKIGGGGIDGAGTITIDHNNNFFIAGQFSGTVDFDPGGNVQNLVSIGANSAFLAKYDFNGNYTWAKAIANGSTNGVSSVNIDLYNNVLIAGVFQGTIDIDPNVGVYNLTSNGNEDIYFAKLDNNGNLSWAKSFGGSSLDLVFKIKSDRFNDYYLTGIFNGVCDYNPDVTVNSLTSNGGHDGFIAKYDNSGNYLWAISYGSSNNDQNYDISIDGVGNIYGIGYYHDTVDFDPGPDVKNLSSNGGYDICLLNYSSTGQFISAKSIGGTGDDLGWSMELKNGSLYYTGHYHDTADFNPDQQIFDLTSNGDFDAFLLKMSAENIDDDNACTIDGCDPVSGIFHNPINIDDGDVCTTDGCDTTTGLINHVANANITNIDTTICYGSSITLTATGNNSSYQACSLSALPINLQSGLVAYYPFCGNANDESGNGNNGAANGAILTNDRHGNINSAYSFDGYSEVIVPHSQNLNINGDLTLSAWFLSDGPPIFRTSHVIVTKRSSVEFNTFPYLLAINYQYGIPTDYKKPIFVSASSYPSGYQYLQSETDVTNNIWNHIVSTINGDSLRIYLNGTLVLTTFQENAKRVLNNATLLIGGGGRTDKPAEEFVGKLDDIGIWNRALTTTEIQQLYTGTSYYWSNGETNTSIIVSPLQTTTYYCTVLQNELSCTDSVTVFVNPIFIDTVFASICEGDSYILPSGQSVNYAAYHPSILQSVTGCDSVIYTKLIVNTLPNISVSNNSPLCEGSLLELFSSGGGSYSWTGPNGFISTQQNPIISNVTSVNAGSYSLIVTDNTDSWIPKTNFSGTSRYGAVSFRIGTKGYIGTGWDGNLKQNDFWEYDPINNVWTQKANFGGSARTDAVGFSIGNKGYIGTGWDGTYKQDFWEYDPMSNTWFQKANFGGTSRYGAISFNIGNKGYLGTGWDGTSIKDDFWEYNPDSNTWLQKANFGGSIRTDAVGFKIGNKGYVGTGWNGTFKQDFWEYDPSSNSWIQKANFIGTARYGAVSFNIGSKGFLGTGWDGTSMQNDLWEYNPATNSWSQKTSFLGSARTDAIGLSIGNKGYIGTGWDTSLTFRNDFWEFSPGNECTSSVSTNVIVNSLPIAIASSNSPLCPGSILNLSSNGGTSYNWTGPNGFTSSQQNPTITNVNAADTGSYNVTVTNTGDIWTQKDNIPGTNRNYALGFSIGDKGYFGTGTDQLGVNYKDFWEYNPVSNSWTQKADFGGTARSSAVGFSIGTKGYIGTGISTTGNEQDFWEYNPLTNSWIQKADFGGGLRSFAVGFSIGNKGYIGTGQYGSSISTQDFWEYNPVTNIWIQKADFGGGLRNCAVGFSINSNGYIGTGADQIGGSYKDFWEYNPFFDSWVQKADCGNTARVFAVGFNIGSKGYIGTGIGVNGRKNDFWEYNPVSNSWNQKTNFGSTARYAAVGFGIGSKGYLGTGTDEFEGCKKDFWDYDPGSGCSSSDSTTVTLLPQYTYYADGDNDGYGLTSNSQLLCAPFGIYTSLISADCNDTLASVHPGAVEICYNNIDDNCDGHTDEGCYSTLNLRLFIEGFYLGGGMMIPSVDPFNYPLLCDTIAVELINKNYPYNILYYDSSTIDIYGWGTFNFPLSIQGNRYYLAVHHRNAMETWSSSSVLFSNATTIYDFTNAKTKAYGSNLSDLGDGNFAIWSGDISDGATGTVGMQDGIVESQDYSDMENALYFTLLGYVPEDITGDGVVESMDYSIMENNVYFTVYSMHP